MGMKQKLNPLSGWFDMVNSTGTNPGDAVVLDNNGKIPVSTIPATAITERFVAASQAEMLALDAQIGDICARTDENKIYQLMNNDPSVLANWIVTNVVSSVNNQTGDVVVNDVKIGSTAPTNPTEGMVWYDTTNDLFKTYNGVGWDIPGQTLKSFPAEFNTTGTTTQFLSSITAMNLPVGMSYLGQVSLSDMPDGITVQAEVQVDIYPQNVVYATMRSAEVPPYEWMVNSYENRGREPVADMKYSDFNFVTLTQGLAEITHPCSRITPTGDFEIYNDGAKDGMTYLLRVENGNTAYTMTLGNGISNPDNVDLTLEANKVNQFVFLAISGTLELQKPAAGGTSEYMEDIRNKTQQIYASGVLPDSEPYDTWIFTSDGMHGVQFDADVAKVYLLTTAFDTEGPMTLLTSVTAPWDIYMGQLNDEGTRLILLGYLSTWRIMFGVNPDEGGTAFMFDDNSPEYTGNDYQDRQTSVPYFKSTTDLTSSDYEGVYYQWYDEGTGEYVQRYLNEFEFMGFNYHNWDIWYLYHPSSMTYITGSVGSSEWNEPNLFSYSNGPTPFHNITAILYAGDGWSYPRYVYGDPFFTGTNHWYAADCGSLNYYRRDANQAFTEADQNRWSSWIIGDGDASIGTINNTVKFLGGKRYYVSGDRYLGYDSIKQIVTQYNVIGYNNDGDDDRINVPSFYRFQNDINQLGFQKQDKLTFIPEDTGNKSTKDNMFPYSLSQTTLSGFQTLTAHCVNISFYDSGNIVMVSDGYGTLRCGNVATPYTITQNELNQIVASGNRLSIYTYYNLPNAFGQYYMSEDGLHLICRDYNNGEICVMNFSIAWDLTSYIDYVAYQVNSNTIFNYDGTAYWAREYDSNLDHYAWTKYSLDVAYDYSQVTLVGTQGSWVISNYQWQNTSFAFSLDGKYIMAMDVTNVYALGKLSTAWDLSTVQTVRRYGGDANTMSHMYFGIPTGDVTYLLPHNYNEDTRILSQNKSVIYPSWETTTQASAEGFKPVTDTTSTSSLTISNLTTVFTPTQDFSLVAGTVMPGMQYIVRLTSGATAYNMTLGTGVTNPYGETLTLTASKTTTVVLFATSSSTLELFGIKTEA